MRWMGILATSGINVANLDSFPACSTGGDADSALKQRTNQPTLVVSGAAHVRLGIRRGLCRFGSRGNGLRRKTLAAHRRFGFPPANRPQPDPTQTACHFLAT